MRKGLKKGFTLIELLVVITIIAILASLAVPTFGRIQERGNITKGISNARQIITALRIYSSDHSGNYPDIAVSSGSGGTGGTGGTGDTSTANGVFRVLFEEQILDNEMIFGCPVSRYGNPDGKVGTNGDQAVQTNENHWAFTTGASDSASGSLPLVYENPVSAAWDPSWNPQLAGTNAPGRSWSGGKVIIGQNDSSVALQQLEDKNAASKLKGGADNLFARFAGADGAEGAYNTVGPE
ncbi:type II secretion system protein [Verrucomicrobium spinosum]|uniref:type II secretion system protein n=1 Tax=Verrucomicrobium spinosum TaxID=2736 RepID=UPI0002D41330|nr:type II secretion system protein [Verrucomicrobium spinosum]